MRIGKIFTFDAAHHLPKHIGQCKNLHGHTYKLEVEIIGDITLKEHSTIDGMVMDFGELKRIVNHSVVDPLDHRDLCD